MSHLSQQKPSVESLLLSIQAYKTVISDYAQRTKQAEEMVVVLMNEKIPQDVFASMVVNKVTAHIEARGIERSTQYLGLIQATLMALTNIQGSKLDPELVEVIKSLTLATGAQ